MKSINYRIYNFSKFILANNQQSLSKSQGAADCNETICRWQRDKLPATRRSAACNGPSSACNETILCLQRDNHLLATRQSAAHTPTIIKRETPSRQIPITIKINYKTENETTASPIKIAVQLSILYKKI